MRYKAIFFDMDGTVLNTLEDLHDGVNAALHAFNMPLISLDDTRRFVGNGAKRLISLAVPSGTDEATTQRVLDWFKAYYGEHCSIKTAPYPGIADAMKTLIAQGARLAVVSNKPDEAVKPLAKEFFEGLLSVAVGESLSVRRKPAPDTVFAAAKELAVDIAQCVYIGDSEVDIATAKNAGMDCISVSWGFRTAEELTQAGASVIVSTAAELLEYLLS